MWWLCQLISWWGVGLNTSDLTQWSGLITRIASDFCWAHQKYTYTVWSIIVLRHLPPWMKNQHGLNQSGKNLIEKNNLSIESSEVNVWLVWILTTKCKSLKRVDETCQKKRFNFWLFCYVDLFFQNWSSNGFYSPNKNISFWFVPHWTLDCSFIFEWCHSDLDLGSERIPSGLYLYSIQFLLTDSVQSCLLACIERCWLRSSVAA